MPIHLRGDRPLRADIWWSLPSFGSSANKQARSGANSFKNRDIIGDEAIIKNFVLCLMSNNPVTNAFFFGRALAEVMSEKLEESFTNAMSDLGKFDAEQRENLRQFMEEVQLKAERSSATTATYPTTGNTNTRNNNTSNSNVSGGTIEIDTSITNSDDLQAMLDRLRAEIATLRAELKQHRN